MRFDQLQPRGGRLPLQTMALSQFHTGHGLEDIENGVLIDKSTGDLIIAMRTGRKRQAVGRYRSPEALIIHRLQPSHDIICVPKISHAITIPVFDCALQKCSTLWSSL